MIDDRNHFYLERKINLTILTVNVQIVNKYEVWNRNCPVDCDRLVK